MRLVLVTGGHDRIFAGAEIGEGWLAEETEDDGVTGGGQLLGDDGVADNGGGSFEAAFPSGPGGVADQEALGGETGSDKHGLADALEIGPTGGEADQIG